MVIDYTATVAAITDQLGDALTAGLPVFGMIIGVVVGLGFFRYLVRAR